MKEKIQVWLAIGCVTFLTAVALFKGINGTIFAVGVGAVAGLGGYVIGKLNNKK